MTSISLLSVQGSGIQDYGRKTPAEMISQLRSWAEHNKKIADAILSASDSDFHVETYLGPWARKGREVLQLGRAKDE